MLKRRIKKSLSKIYRCFIMDTAPPLEKAYQDGSNIITKGFMLSPREIACTDNQNNDPKSKLIKI